MRLAPTAAAAFGTVVALPPQHSVSAPASSSFVSLLAGFPRSPTCSVAARDANLHATKRYVASVVAASTAFEVTRRAEEAARGTLREKIARELQLAYALVGRLTMETEGGGEEGGGEAKRAKRG